MGAIMLIEIWERLCGYDKWIPTEAIILSSKMVGLRGGWFRKVKTTSVGAIQEWRATSDICWIDKSGRSHKASYTVSERSSLFHLYEGQTVSIRYNSANTDEYYIRELFRHKMFMLLLYAFMQAIGILIICCLSYLFTHI